MSGSAIDEMVTDCVAVRIRLISRAVTSLYDTALAGHGVTIAQANLLAALGKAGPCAPSKLGEILQLERSTVSRNVNLLRDHGWIEAVATDAKGLREIALTPAGRAKIDALMPQWRQAQRQAVELLGGDGTSAVGAVADRLGYPPKS